MVKEITQEAVSAALSTAVDQNGYTELLHWPAEHVAIDLADHDVDFEAVDTDVLIPFVTAWQEGRKAPKPAAAEATEDQIFAEQEKTITKQSEMIEELRVTVVRLTDQLNSLSSTAVKGGRLGLETIRMFTTQFKNLHAQVCVSTKEGAQHWEPAVILHAAADALPEPLKEALLEITKRFLATRHLAMELDFPVLPPAEQDETTVVRSDGTIEGPAPLTKGKDLGEGGYG